MDKIQSISQIEQLIKKKDLSYAFQIYIPSLKREIRFTEINTSQQKRLVKSIIDSPVFKTEFIYTLKEIIEENIREPGVFVSQLNVLDKLMIALKLRIISVGGKLELEVDGEEGRKVKVDVDLVDIYEKAKESLVSTEPKEICDDYFKVVCCIPSIDAEFKFEKEIRGRFEKMDDIKNASELRNIFGEAFIGEVVKYIDKLLIKGESGDYIEYTWEDTKFVDRIKIVEMFKSTFLKEIVKYINTVKEQSNKIEILNLDVEGKKIQKELRIDSSFFMISSN